VGEVTWVLWQWSARYDRWDWLTESAHDEAQRHAVLRGYRRRNPKGAKFRWKPKDEGAPKKFRTRLKGA